MANDPKIQIDIEARDKASDTIHDVADDAEALEKLSPEITVTADTGTAVSDIGDVADAAGRVSHDDTVLVIKAQIDQAKGQLKELDAQLKATGEQADTTNRKLDDTTGAAGPGNLRGNAISDLTGPLGDASGAASDFAGVFDGLGDAAEAAAGKLGLSQGVADKLGSTIGGLGVAVAAGAAIWTLWTQRQQAAKKAAEDHAKAVGDLGAAILGADRAAAVANFHKLYDDAIKSADEFGLKQADVIRFLTGQASAIPGVTEAYRDLQTARDAASGDVNEGSKAAGRLADFEKLTAQLQINRAEVLGSTDAAGALATANDKLGAALVPATQDQKDMTTAVKNSKQPLQNAATAVDELEAGYGRLQDRLSTTRAIEDFKQAMIDAQTAIHDKSDDTVVDVRGVEDAIVAAGRAAKLTPIEVQTAINKVEQGDVDGAFLFMQSKIDEKGPLQVQVALHATIPKLKLGGRGGTSIVVEVDQPSAGGTVAAGSTNVNINMPPGSRGVDVVRQVAGQARRSGRRFGNQVVDYASR